MTNDAAAVTGDFSNFRIIQGRKVVQLIVEVPIEAANHALDVLGIPRSDVGCPVAIVRLTDGVSS